MTTAMLVGTNQQKFTLKMATAMSAETLDNFQVSTWLIPESRSFTSSVCVFVSV
jgi:hypothetical protein